MTNVSTQHPHDIPFIELTEKGRQISFRKECLGDVRILRKINEGIFDLLIEGIRTPYVDEDIFPSGTILTYLVEVDLHDEKQQYEFKARL